jgi:hypothetical protein
MKSTKTVKLSTLIVLMAIEFLALACVGSVAASSQVYNSLARSRDALLDQRQYLQGEADRLGQRITALQTQLDTVNGYLRDNDRALRDVETAMRRAQ